MKKSYSLKGKDGFREVFKRGRRYTSGGIQLIVLRQKNTGESAEKKNSIMRDRTTKIGISINSRYGMAVERNKAKRRLRALCGELMPVMEEGYCVVLRPDNNFKNVRYEHAQENIRRLFKKAGVLKQ